MIVFKHKFNGAEIKFDDDKKAEVFARLALGMKNLNHHEFISEKFKLNYKDGIITGRRTTKKDQRAD